MFRYLPEEASSFAKDVDWINNFITDVSVFCIAAICGTMLFFAIRYRRKKEGEPTPRFEGSNVLEAIWTAFPAVVSAYVAYQGIVIYKKMVKPPKAAFEVNVTAKQWQWKFKYDNGKESINELVVPVNKPVKLLMRSEPNDVIHSLFIPAMRVKKDVLPSMYTHVVFKPIKTGEYRIFCTEYCGAGHYNMLAKLRVVPQAEFERWLNDRSEEILAKTLSPKEVGKKLYVSKGCNACHSIDGSKIIGPSFLGLYGKKEKMADGSVVNVDEVYLEDSMLYPNKKIVRGFPPNVMPSFKDQLSTDEITSLIAFIKSLKEGEAKSAKPPAKKKEESTEEESGLSAKLSSEGKKGYNLYKEKGCAACHSLDGSRRVGPSFKGLYGKTEDLQGGKKVKVDEKYIEHSIKEPASQIVAGFTPSMPKIPLSDEEIKSLVQFIKEVK
ncbi:MAG: cytochrome c oxidase subunit II [Candidatus Dadabacteria bacterium]|nr:MAG: cytochrome c oxidase subunit II [Candidatus Dadabacteria bacterium]